MGIVEILLFALLGASMIGGFFAILSHLKSLESIAKSLKEISEKMKEKK